jgi:hypothetical protein
MRKQDWHAGFLQSLAEMADIVMQRQAWIEKAQSRFPSPTELVCQVFDDSGVDDLLAKGLVFSEATDNVLRRLSGLVARVNLDVRPQELLSSKHWFEVTEEAALALDMVGADLMASAEIPDRGC